MREMSLLKQRSLRVILFGSVFFTGLFLYDVSGYNTNYYKNGNVYTTRDFQTSKFLNKQNFKFPENTITTSWLYHRSIPKEVVQNIKTLHSNNPENIIHVYCGSSQCTNVIESLNNPQITTRFLVIPDLLRHISLKAWFMRHPLNKILTGVHFEDHLQQAVQLAHLWHHGGIFVGPTVRIKSNLFLREENEWVTFSSTEPDIPSILDISSFSPRHPFINNLIYVFTKEYAMEISNVSFSFKEIVWNAYTKYCNTNNKCPINSNHNYYHSLEIINNHDKKTFHDHFGTLKYEGMLNRRKYPIGNLGDHVQGFPGVQFLPFVDFLYDRDFPVAPESSDNHTIFFNAWWAVNNIWPPAPNIDPIMLSIHTNPAFRRGILKSRNKTVKFLKQKEPIGCRDIPTLEFLTKLGVDSFFSACLTLLFKNPSSNKNRTDKIYFVDVDKKFHQFIPPDILNQSIVLSHDESIEIKGKDRFRLAFQLIEKYSRAKLVVTQRIHCALPCVAMDIPVILIHDRRMPGGDPKRVEGLTELFHTLVTHQSNKDDVQKWLNNFNWNDPPRNPNFEIRMRHIATLWNVIRKRRTFYENAHKFGLIPLTSIIAPSKLLFHLIFIPPLKFHWYHWRCVESIFRHHSDAKVIIYSNTLEQSMFNVFTEVGFDFQVKRYNIVDIAKDTPFERIEAATPDLLSFLLLYKHGGVYLNINAIVLRPIHDLGSNMLGWDSENDVKTVMKLEKHHPFLRATLDRYFSSTKESKGTFSKVWQSWSDEAEKRAVKIISTKIFNMKDFEEECFYKTSGKTFDSQMKIVQKVAYVVQLSPSIPNRLETGEDKLISGTICKHILNFHCVLCDKTY